MISVTLKNRAKFVFALAMMPGVIFYGLWFLFRWNGWVWHQTWSAPGFILLIGSWPWHYVWFQLRLFVFHLTAWHMPVVFTALFVSLGFSFNCSLAYLLIAMVIRWVRRNSVNQPIPD
jgi:hypothetical protein